MNTAEILIELEQQSDPAAKAGMARFAITTRRIMGVSIPKLRMIAGKIGRDHRLAGELWAIDSRETRILAAMIEEIGQVDSAQMDDWALDFDNWEICDQCCANLFEKSPLAFRKCLEWSEQPEEFVKRAAFVLMARLAVSNKAAADEDFLQFLPVIASEATDDRNFVCKAVNWALRQIGKRSRYLNERAVETAREIQQLDLKSARWIAADALRELSDPAVVARIKR